MASSYTAGDIEVLEGLEPVRKRPAMYIGGTDKNGFHHLLWEIVDNAVDEAINGHASLIEVVLDADRKGASVTDNGRGIPVDKHPRFKRSALELILCTLHAGGKFGGKSYQVAGGLHGVGSSVVNALSIEMTALVRRDGVEYVQTYSQGKPATRLKKNGATRKRGTCIHFRPDPEIFGKSQSFDLERVTKRLEAKSYLHKGLRVVLRDEMTKEKIELHHPGGIVDFLAHVVEERGKATIPPEPFTMERDGREKEGGDKESGDKNDDIRLEVALTWTESTEELIRSYANGIPTPSGGTHENGLKAAISKAVRSFMEQKGIQPKGVTVTAEDIREGLVALLSVYVQEPQFQGQTKDRLNNQEVTSQVDGALRVAMEDWFFANQTVAEAIVARIILSARAREASRAASQKIQRKSAVSHRLNLPGKLADCSSTSPSESELFLVEGDSAGGNAKRGRDRKTQAILPLRGKVLNAERVSLSQVLKNKELSNIVSALGCGVGKDFDMERLRYGRIFLLMDADSDGHHIATLLLTFFYRVLPQLVRAGRIYLAQPPLYRIDAGKETHWALDEVERDAVLAKLPKNLKPKISRFKGLGEMDAEELKSTTLDPKKRRALRVTVPEELEADQVIQELMGKDPATRYRFIMDHAGAANADDLDL